MIIKKFQGKTEKEAVEAAKKELGENVVVMNVKNTKPKGAISFFKPAVIEVTVAKEEENEKYPEPFKAQAQVQPQMIINPQAPAKLRERDNSVFWRDILPEEPEKEDIGGKALEEKLDSLQSLLEKQLQNKEELQKEEQAEELDEIDAFMRVLYNTMLENEVKEIYINQIIDGVEGVNKANVSMDYVLANIYQKMILKFGKPSVILPAQNIPKVVFFIGPTGVGKTTTIAKIASKFCVEEKKKVALLTADTYRIAAAEQLRTYANILEVPFRVVYTIEDVEEAYNEFKSYDYVLVDTAGHSHQNGPQRESMKQFVNCLGDKVEKEVYLVLSATTKYRDLVSIADMYSQMTDFKLIFTKLDETTTLGNVLNLKLYTGASLSYVTYGQNVPDDIEKFNPQKTVKQLLSGRN